MRRPLHRPAEPDAGVPVTFLALVRNQSGIVDHFDLEVRGLPREWWTITPSTVQLIPFGAEGGSHDADATVSFHPPRSSDALAGPRTVRVVARSRSNAVEWESNEALVRIAPFELFEGRLRPARVRATRTANYVLPVRNRGNAHGRLEGFVDGKDASGKTVEMTPADIPIMPGETRAVTLSPVVDPGQLKQDTDYIEIGKKEGAKLVAGGDLLKLKTPGYYLQPALFTEATNQMRISREEIFGPVASVIRVKNYEEALATANDTEFGLSAGIVTTSLKYATHFKRNAEAGMVMVNVPTAGVDFHVPFGGRKGSSYGPKEQGKYAAEFFTQVKTAYTAAG